jgi:hypothetical protein
VPKSAKPFSGKHVCPNSAHQIPDFGAFWHPIVHFVARRFLPIFIFRCYESIYGVMTLVPKKFRKLPSARRIFPKVFRRSHFWTSILVHFLRNFSSLVQSRIEI